MINTGQKIHAIKILPIRAGGEIGENFLLAKISAYTVCCFNSTTKPYDFFAANVPMFQLIFYYATLDSYHMIVPDGMLPCICERPSDPEWSPGITPCPCLCSLIVVVGIMQDTKDKVNCTTDVHTLFTHIMWQSSNDSVH